MPKVLELDMIYISFDEPNAEENYRDLLVKVPRAKRVHGIKGFDAALREAFKLAETEWFFIIDGDNKIVRKFCDLEFELPESPKVLSWASKNFINSLIYGNGGVKLWHKSLMNLLNCHDKNEGVDWCHKIKYQQMNNWYSYSFCNASPFQAFRAGFREGVKLCLDENGFRDFEKLKNLTKISPTNLRRAITWMTVGEDIMNGSYAIYGARLGFLKTICEKEFDIKKISSFEWFESLWNGEFSFVRDGFYREHYDQMAKDIFYITGLNITNLNSDQSKLFKNLMLNPRRSDLMSEIKAESFFCVEDNFIEKSLL